MLQVLSVSHNSSSVSVTVVQRRLTVVEYALIQYLKEGMLLYSVDMLDVMYTLGEWEEISHI